MHKMIMRSRLDVFCFGGMGAPVGNSQTFANKGTPGNMRTEYLGIDPHQLLDPRGHFSLYRYCLLRDVRTRPLPGDNIARVRSVPPTVQRQSAITKKFRSAIRPYPRRGGTYHEEAAREAHGRETPPRPGSGVSAFGRLCIVPPVSPISVTCHSQRPRLLTQVGPAVLEELPMELRVVYCGPRWHL